MNLSQFIATYTGQAVSYDGVVANKGQCEQLVCLYWQKVIGFSCPPIGAAKDLWTNPTVLSSFEQIPFGQEQAGDVAVWGASNLIDSPEYGHTDIVITPGFTGFDSNWGNVNNAEGYPVAHEVQHNNTDVLGFLRYKENGMAPQIALLTAEQVTNDFAAYGIKGENPDGTPSAAQIESYTTQNPAVMYSDFVTYLHNELQTAQGGVTKAQVLAYIGGHLT